MRSSLTVWLERLLIVIPPFRGGIQSGTQKASKYQTDSAPEGRNDGMGSRGAIAWIFREEWQPWAGVESCRK